MKVLLAPDKFKGSLSAQEFCDLAAEALRALDPSIEIQKMPLADGGEGSLLVLEPNLGFDRRYLKVHTPRLEGPLIQTFYGIKGDRAYIELAHASGLGLVPEELRNPLYTSTLGTGELILDALNQGLKEVLLFVGGSASNDGGVGIAHALGFRFLDKEGKELAPIGANLHRIKDWQAPSEPAFQGLRFQVLTDVDNPLLGHKGAAKVYAPQKGASESEVELLEEGLANLQALIVRKLGLDVQSIPGGGAAGGVGAGLWAFLGAEITLASPRILALLDFEAALQSCDWVISGEGQLDAQSLQGKVVYGVWQKCQAADKKLSLLLGNIALNPTEIKSLNLLSLRSILGDHPISKEEAMQEPSKYFKKSLENLWKDYQDSV